jgi:hypothetical protein
MEPFLKKNGFVLEEKLGNEFTYRHVENTDAQIYFTIDLSGKRIMPEFSHKDRPRSIPMYTLSIFLEEPEFSDPPVLDGYWYFDNEEQLIGALEEQMILLREKAIPWLIGDYKLDVDKIILTSADRREKKWNSSTEEEREIDFMQIRKTSESWRNRRVYPKEWSLNLEES